MHITPEMREIARLVNHDRSSKRALQMWKNIPANDRDYRWGKQVFLRMYRVNRLSARQWAVRRFGEKAKDLIARWLAFE